MSNPRSFLIIQTAFTGDVILATSLIEKLHTQFPEASIDFLLRKGNESLFHEHPIVRNVLVWDKKKSKIRNLLRVLLKIRSLQINVVINVHRFTSSGLLTIFSAAGTTIGFKSNPLSLFFSKRIEHTVGEGVHEIDRNQKLIASLTGSFAALPRLYPSLINIETANGHRISDRPYCCIAPASVWFTKQFPKEKWVALIDRPEFSGVDLYLLGAASDADLCEFVRLATTHSNVVNLAGRLDYLESAALIAGARMNYVNDSAPMHMASAVNAPVTAIYCSTVPAFGFGPLSSQRAIVETTSKLDCRPCGLHGFQSCPEGHFKCALTIEVSAIPVTPEPLSHLPS